jgi:hypothetical protein
VRLRQNKQLPVFTSADDNMASNERFIQISETDTETFIQSMKNDNNPRCPAKMFKTYIRRQPSDLLKPDSKFYLSVLPRYHDSFRYLNKSFVTRHVVICRRKHLKFFFV